MQAYEVTITSKFPAYGETPGVEVIYAKDRKEAIKKARQLVSRSGHTSQDGPVVYRAKKFSQY